MSGDRRAYLVVGADFDERVDHVSTEERIDVGHLKLALARPILGPVAVVAGANIIRSVSGCGCCYRERVGKCGG